jgi:hypothetical protein
MGNVVKIFAKHFKRFSRSRSGSSGMLGILLLSGLSLAQTSVASSCAPEEGVFFSCRLEGNGRVVSICTVPKTPPFASIVYRYETGTKNAITYTASVENRNRFLGTVSAVSPKATIRQVWFELDGRKYITTSCVGGDCAHRGGLILFRNGQLEMSQACTADSTNQPWFSSKVVHFGSDFDSSHSNTDLIQLRDYDNGVNVLYPRKSAN